MSAGRSVNLPVAYKNLYPEEKILNLTGLYGDLSGDLPGKLPLYVNLILVNFNEPLKSVL